MSPCLMHRVGPGAQVTSNSQIRSSALEAGMEGWMGGGQCISIPPLPHHSLWERGACEGGRCGFDREGFSHLCGQVCKHTKQPMIPWLWGQDRYKASFPRSHGEDFMAWVDSESSPFQRQMIHINCQVWVDVAGVRGAEGGEDTLSSLGFGLPG